MKTTHKAILLTVLTAVIGSASVNALADDQWQKNHPRREQVNHRLNNQNNRIHQEVKEGDMSRQKAQRLHREDRRVRQEEHNMASKDGGHITQQQHNVINKQENHISNQIGQ